MSPKSARGPVATIRPAAPGDVDALMGMVHDLAHYERSPDSVEMDHTQLYDALFRVAPTVFAHVAEVDGRVLGMAIWFLTFSTWTGRPGIYLEDLFVRPEARSSGLGGALLAELAAVAHRSGYRRIEWSVLDWNEGALRLYRSIGAAPMDGWTVYRLDGAGLADLADESDRPG